MKKLYAWEERTLLDTCWKESFWNDVLDGKCKVIVNRDNYEVKWIEDIIFPLAADILDHDPASPNSENESIRFAIQKQLYSKPCCLNCSDGNLPLNLSIQATTASGTTKMNSRENHSWISQWWLCPYPLILSTWFCKTSFRSVLWDVFHTSAQDIQEYCLYS